MSQKSEKKIGVNPYSGYEFVFVCLFVLLLYNIKIGVFSPSVLRAFITTVKGLKNKWKKNTKTKTCR